MVKPSDFKAVHRLIQFHYTRVVNPVTVSRSKLIASSSPAAFPSNGFTQFHPKSSFHTFSSIPTTKNVGFSQICGLASVKPRFKNVNFASAFRLFSTSGFRKVDGSFARKVVEKPMRAVSSSVGRYRVALGLHVDAFWKKNSPVVFGAGGVFVCIFLWRVMFGIASTFVGLSEGMAKYGFLVLSSAIVAFAGMEATPLVGHMLVQYWRCDFERKTKDEGNEDDSGFREKESRYSHRGRISSVAFVTEKSPESFVDDQFPWLSSKKNLGGVARRRISVAMSVGESLWLSSTEEIGGSPLQTNSSVGAKLNRKLFPHMASKNHRD